MASIKSIDAVQSFIRELEAELASDPRQQELEIWREAERRLLALNGTERHNVIGSCG